MGNIRRTAKNRRVSTRCPLWSGDKRNLVQAALGKCGPQPADSVRSLREDDAMVWASNGLCRRSGTVEQRRHTAGNNGARVDPLKMRRARGQLRPEQREVRAGEHDRVHGIAAGLLEKVGECGFDGGGLDRVAAQLSLGQLHQLGRTVPQDRAVGGELVACVYFRRTVPGVPSKPIVRVALASAAGLIAGIVPTTGIGTEARTAGSATVLAVLQAMTIRSGSNRRASAVNTC
jgi:hypothetical protein